MPTSEGDHEVGIVRAHLEEDAAKTTHVGGRTGRIGGADYSLVDFNRGGTPLVEIVTGPDIHSSEDARRFLQLLRQTIVELGISDAEMEKGTLRVDANVSVRPAGSSELRTRCELKNMNSFRFVAQGIDAEVARQIAVYESGGEVVQETLRLRRRQRRPDRTALEGGGRRLPLLPRARPRPDRAAADLIERLRDEVPESPARRIRRIEADLDLDRAVVLVTGGLDRLWQATVVAGAEPVPAANVIANRLAGVDTDAVDPVELAKLVEARDRIPRTALDEALGKVAEPGFSAQPYLAQEAVSDSAELEPIITQVLEANPGQVEAYRSGKEGLLGFFVGQVMKETGGKANARAVSELVREKLQA